MSEYATDPTTLRAEARDIEIGAPDGDGYAGWLRACADRIEELESQLKTHESKEDVPNLVSTQEHLPTSYPKTRTLFQFES